MKIPKINKKGNVIDAAKTLIIVGVFLAIGIYVLNQIFTAIPSLGTFDVNGTAVAPSAAYNASVSVRTNTWSGMTLFAIVMIVIAASAILGVVMYSLVGHNQ